MVFPHFAICILQCILTLVYNTPMNPFMRALVASATVYLLSACHIPSPPIPPSIPVPPGVYLSLGGASVVVEGVRVEGRLAEDEKGITVQVYNEGPVEVVLLLDEWTLTVGGETSRIYAGTAIRPRIGKRPIGSIRLAPGELHLTWLGMATRHKDRHPFKGSAQIALAFVFLQDEVKRIGTLKIPLLAEDPI